MSVSFRLDSPINKDPVNQQFVMHQGRIYEVGTQKIEEGVVQKVKSAGEWIGKKLGVVDESKTINNGQYKVVQYSKPISLDDPGRYKSNEAFKKFVKNNINPSYDFELDDDDPKKNAEINRKLQTIKLDAKASRYNLNDPDQKRAVIDEIEKGNLGFDLENKEDVKLLVDQIKTNPDHPYRHLVREEAGALYMPIPLEMTRGAAHQGQSLMLYMPPEGRAICFNFFDSSGSPYTNMADFTQAMRPFVLALQSMEGNLDDLLKGGKIINLDIKQGMFRVFDSDPNKGYIYTKKGKDIKLDDKVWQSIRDFSNKEKYGAQPKDIDDNKPNFPKPEVDKKDDSEEARGVRAAPPSSHANEDDEVFSPSRSRWFEAIDHERRPRSSSASVGSENLDKFGLPKISGDESEISVDGSEIPDHQFRNRLQRLRGENSPGSAVRSKNGAVVIEEMG